jgi:hypothetical protein
MEHFTKILERLQHNKDKLKPRRIGFLKEDEEAG